MKNLKTKIIVLCLVLFGFMSSEARAQLTEGQSAIVGGVIGYVIGKNSKPQPVYGQVPPSGPYAPSYPPYQPQPHQYSGYCGGYTGEQYAYCMGNIQRIKNDEAYRRGLYGY